MAVTTTTVPLRSALAPAKAFPGTELTAHAPLIKSLIFGPQTAGKTRLCLSFCQDRRFSPALWLDATNGTAGILEEVKAAGARVYQCGDSKAVEEQIDWLLAYNHDPERMTEQFGFPGPFKVLIADDLTESYSKTKEAVAKAKGRGTADNLEGVDYAAVYDRMRRVYRKMIQLASPPPAGAGMHVVVTCWPESEEDPIEKTAYLVPKFSGKFGYETVGYFDIVGFLSRSIRKEAGETKFTNALITMSSQHHARDRFGVLPPKLEMPTATAIMDLIEQKFTPPPTKES